MQALLAHIGICFGAALTIATLYIGALAYVEWKESKKNKYKKMFGL